MYFWALTILTEGAMVDDLVLDDCGDAQYSIISYQ